MTPEVTVVVPINGVEGQLRECLDSLVGQRLDAIEIIAINDASEDNCARILDEFAAVTPNLRVITNTEAVGPGRCRNIGIEAATGEYVGFVDGDDWVSPDFYESALETARRTQSDVVVVDHVRAFADGRMEPNRSRDTLLRAPTDGFRLIEHPDIIRNIPTVWNKLFRRDFISRPEFEFDDGWYEDVPITNLALCIAESIAVAPAGTYFYRQRPSSILFSRDDSGHLVVIDRYRGLLTDLGRRGIDERILRHIFAYSVWHLRLVESRGLTRFTPNGLEQLRAGLTSYLTEFDHLYSSALLTPVDIAWHQRILQGPSPLQPARRIAGALTRRSRARIRKVRKGYAAQKVRRKREFFYGRFLEQPLRENQVAFASYWFGSPAGNPLAIYEELLRRSPGARCVWILKGNADPLGLPPSTFVRQGSPAYYELLATSKYFVNNVNFPHFVTKRAGSVELQTTHGTPLKLMGIHESRAPVSTLNINGMLARSARWDYCLSPNPYTSEIWRGAYPLNYSLLEMGYPRNDILHRYSAHDVASVKRRLGIDPDHLVLLYAPTYRQLKNRRVTPAIDFVRLAEAAGPNVTILNRSHYFVRAPGTQSGSVIDASEFPVTNELLIACDVLVTDYSSIMFDFAALRRPIINYVPDCDDYMAERGTYFDIREKHAGLVTSSENELHSMISTRAWNDPGVARAIEEFADEFVGFDDGESARRVVEHVFADLIAD